MDLDLELISPSDKCALLALSTPAWLSRVHTVLAQLGYKVHVGTNHEDCLLRLGRVNYHIIFLEELFTASTAEANRTRLTFERMPMSQRRHTVSFLIGDAWQTLHPLQAFQQSVHAVINPTDLGHLSLILQQVVADHDHFLRTYREVELRVAHG